MACGGGVEQMEDEDLATAGVIAAPNDHEHAHARPH